MVLGWGRKTSTRDEDSEEMSMEEILASIRRYVAEDQKVREQEKPRYIPQEESYSPYVDYPREQPRISEKTLERQFSASSPIDTGYDPYASGHTTSVTEYSENPYAEQPLQNEILTNEEPIFTSMQEERIIEQGIEEAIQEEREALASPETISASAAAFNRLVEATRPALDRELGTSAGMMTLDRLITDLARPMIRDWLDHNLPQIVEVMVAREIEKITNRLGG